MNKFPVKSKLLTSRARDLRANSTDAEHKLWQHMRNRQLEGCKFRRQYPAYGYILDFSCEELRLGIELDGGQHNDAPAQIYDQKRTARLQQEGWTILRFWNNDVFDCTQGVLIRIVETIQRLQCPSPAALESLPYTNITSGAATSPRGEVSEPVPSPARTCETAKNTSPLGEVGAAKNRVNAAPSFVAPGEGQH